MSESDPDVILAALRENTAAVRSGVQAAKELTDEVKRLRDAFGKVLSVEPSRAIPSGDPRVELAREGAGLLRDLLGGGKKKGRR